MKIFNKQSIVSVEIVAVKQDESLLACADLQNIALVVLDQRQRR